MNKVKQALGIGALVLALSIGCTKDKPEYVPGTITAERGTMAQIVEQNFLNQTVRTRDPIYVLQIQTSQGLYTASVNEWYSKPLAALALAIKVGSQVRIEKKDLDNFGEDKIGYLSSDEIIVDKP